MGFLSDLFDPAGITSGDSGNALSALFDPAGGIANNFGIDRGPLSDWYDQKSEYFDNISDFEMSQLSDWGQKFKRNPEQLFLGAGDPLSAKMWNGILGTDYTPYVNQWGGPTKESYQSAEEKGVDTSNSQGSHAVAQAVASYFAGGAAGDAAGPMFGSAAEGTTAGAALDAGATGTEALGMADTVGGLASSVGSGAAAGGTVAAGNALSTDSDNFWGDVGKGIGAGALGGFLNSGVDYAGAAGVTDPQYKRLANSTLNGAVRAAATNQDVGQGALYGFGNAATPMALNQGGSMLGGMFDNKNEYEYDPTGGGNFGGTATANVGETGYAPRAYLGVNNNDGMDSFKSLGGIAEGGRNPADMGVSSAPSPVSAFIASVLGTGGGRGNSPAAGGGYGNMAASLMGLYNANRQKKQLKEQMGSLNNLFTPNSPYAQQLRQATERKDAAAGRRSQYGPREAQMAAQLAEKQASMAPQMMQYNQALGGLNNMMVNNGLQFGQQFYRNAPQMQRDYGSLMNLFNGGR